MKKSILLIFFLVFIQGMAEIKDNLKMLSQNEIEEIEERIKLFEEKNDIKIVIETSKYEEGLIVERPEKTIIIRVNLLPENRKKAIEKPEINTVNTEKTISDKDKKVSKKIKQ